MGVRQSKLMAEEGGFGRITIRCGDMKGLGRVNERLGLLHKAGECEHCSSFLLRWQRVVLIWLLRNRLAMSSQSLGLAAGPQSWTPIPQ